MPGKTYEISYRAANPPVAGLGYVAVRDTTAWLKHQPDALATVRFAYGYGSSQSGRFLRGFLYEGFNTDEHDRQVFDGVIAHIAGASRLCLNERWAKPTGLGVYNATAFPFADASLRDPVSGAQEGLLDNARMRSVTRRRSSTRTRRSSTGAPAASPRSSTPARTAPPISRCPTTSASTSSPGRSIRRAGFPAEISNGQQTDNPVDYWWTMRALLLAMHKWVKEGIGAAAESVPAAAGSHAGAGERRWRSPSIPGVASPRALTAGGRTANPYFKGGAGAGAPLPLARAGGRRGRQRARRHPAARCRRAARHLHRLEFPQAGDRIAPGELVSLLGSSIFFPATRAARAAAKDPRRSIEERYRSQEDYLAKVEQAADALVKAGYLLVDDEPRILQRASDQWDIATSHGR